MGPDVVVEVGIHAPLATVADAVRPLHADGWRRYAERLVAVAEGREAPPDPSLPHQGPDAAPNPLTRGDAP